MDLARSLQEVTEEIMLRMVRHVHAETGEENLVLAGGVALNCVGNGRILREGPFEGIWIQPASGDAGGALGAALSVWHEYLGNERHPTDGRDGMQGAQLGPSFSPDHIERFLDEEGAPANRYEFGDLARRAAELIASGHVVGWFDGRMEFGPRALGNRSILGDARSPDMQATLNLRIKFRESFRPFAPAVMLERVSDYFDLDRPSPYMLIVAPVRQSHRRFQTDSRYLQGIDRRREIRSDVPAITHVDHSARIQTVDARVNGRFHQLLTAFEQITGCPMVINTSFNVRGEPIVCSPADAYRCFMRTQMDYLVLGDYLLAKDQQPDSKRQRLPSPEEVVD
jgi:carbamoyltransferase